MRAAAPIIAGIDTSYDSRINTINFQAQLDGGDITKAITKAGVYRFDSTLFLDDNTTLNWSDGTIYQKDAVYSNCFINRGALTKTFNYNIEINGMTLDVNGKETDPEHIYGGRGQLQFFYINGLTITDFYCDNLGSFQFAIEAAKWENLYYDTIYIEGHKDGLDFLTGHNGLVKNVTLKTFDDGVFLGGIGFPSAQLEAMGDVHDMEFVNINYIDSSKILPARGFLFYLGSWDNWQNGNTYQTGDYSTNLGNIYQVNNSSGFSTTGANAPVHTSGIVVGADGISWHHIDTGTATKAEVYNISIDSSFFYNPYSALTWTYTDNAFTRTIYPGTEGNAKSRNISLTNSYISNTVLIRQQTGIIDITLENNTYDSLLQFVLNENGIGVGDSLYINSTGGTFQYCNNFIEIDDQRVYYKSNNDSYLSSTFTNTIAGTGELRAMNHDLPFSTLSNITPVLSDTCRNNTGKYQWDGDSWELL